MDDPAQPITPLLLLPLVENAFKHGVSDKREEAWVHICIILKNKTLEAKIENSASPENLQNESGIGLKNVRRQLDLLFPNCHEIRIESVDDIFRVHLTVT